MVKVAFIGQAPPKTEPIRPFGRSSLYKWFESVGITLELVDKYFTFGAVYDLFPGLNKNKGHAVPTPEQISEARPRLAKHLKEFDPEILVPIGKLSIEECFGKEKIKLEEYIGKEFLVDPYNCLGKKIKVIPFPHPSGASTWIYQKENRKLLDNALKLLQKEVIEH